MNSKSEMTPDDDPYNEFLWGGDFDERQEAELDRKNTRVSSMTEPTQTTPEDDPWNELLWGGNFDERQEAELERKNRPGQTTIWRWIWQEIKVAVRRYFAPIIWMWNLVNRSVSSG